jgi:hypothetical protein
METIVQTHRFWLRFLPSFVKIVTPDPVCQLTQPVAAFFELRLDVQLDQTRENADDTHSFKRKGYILVSFQQVA